MADPTTCTTTFADQAMAHMSSLYSVALRRTAIPTMPRTSSRWRAEVERAQGQRRDGASNLATEPAFGAAESLLSATELLAIVSGTTGTSGTPSAIGMPVLLGCARPIVRASCVPTSDWV